jgi:hypothetical protein
VRKNYRDEHGKLDNGKTDQNKREFDKVFSQMIRYSNTFFLLPESIEKKTNLPYKITNAWLKMFELCHLPEISGIIKNAKSELNMMFLAEFPGAFIHAMKYYIAKTRPIILTTNNWKWMGTSISSGLTDEYGLYKNYPENWILMDNSKSKEIDEKLSKYKDKFDIVTGDIGKPIENWLNIEEEMYYEDLGQFISAIMVLKKNGTAILKMFTSFTEVTLCLLRLAISMFDKVRIIKPRTSKELNDEVYWILSGFKGYDAKKLLYLLDNERQTFLDIDDFISQFFRLGNRYRIHLPLYVGKINSYILKFLNDPGLNIRKTIFRLENKRQKDYMIEWLNTFPVFRLSENLTLF